MGDLVPRAAHRVEPTGNAPLDPAVLAEMRRTNGDRDQLAWDACADPALMLKALLASQPDIGVLLPPARFIELATTRFEAAPGQVDQRAWTMTMQSAFRHLAQGRVDSAIEWLRHAYSGAGLATPDDAYREMADVFRAFYPSAPKYFNLTSLNARAKGRIAMRPDEERRP